MALSKPSFSKLSSCLQQLRSSRRFLILLPKENSYTLQKIELCRKSNTITARHFTSENRKGPKSSIRLPAIVTKDRLILLGFGVLIVGCLIGWEGYHNQSRQNTKQMHELHAIVIKAENCVKDQKYEEAIAHYQQARQLVQQVKMSSQTVQNKVVLNIVDQLGHLAYELGNWAEAEILLNQTLHIMKQCGTTEEEDVYIEIVLRLAKIDTVYERKDDAIEKFEFCIANLESKISVVDIYSEECSERITLYGLVLTEYGTYTREIGLLDESEKAFSKALNICRNVLGPTHEQTSVLANDLATVYDEKGRYNKAIRLAEKAIRIASETSPENLATYKYNLGHILLHKGDLKRARKALREALQIAEENDDQDTKAIIESSIMKLDLPSS